jgi:hypothetical protein
MSGGLPSARSAVLGGDRTASGRMPKFRWQAERDGFTSFTIVKNSPTQDILIGIAYAE